MCSPPKRRESKTKEKYMSITKTKQPAFHITGEIGWINDPNGLVYYGGQYHAFFQYHPYATQWGPMHWGHVVSDDLTHWNYLPVALTPGDACDKNGCFSGSAIIHDGKLWLMYTGFIENQGGESIRQIQCLAESTDGITFQKYGVVIGEDKLPSGYAPCDFRDPKVWHHDGYFWCIVAARKVDGRGRILLFKSPDLFDWSFVSDLLGKDSLGTMIECPDYNEELGYLLYCEQFRPGENGEHLNVHTCSWATGKIDYASGSFQMVQEGVVDYGFDMYAPQTFAGKPVLTGWLNMWDRNVPSAQYGFAGMLTLPRAVSIQEGRLWQEPIVNATVVAEQDVAETLTDKVKTGVITIKAEGLESLAVKMRADGEHYTTLTLLDGKWVFDRSHAGEEIKGVEDDPDSLSGIRRMPYSGKEQVTLTIVMDAFSIEVFEDGRAMGSTVYPPDTAIDFTLEVQATSCHYTKAEVK